MPVTTFDRYLLARYFHVFAVFFVAALGLYIVMDGFTNLDGFQAAAADGGTAALLAVMGRHYLYHSAVILELVGPTLAVMAIVCVMGLLLKHGELNPVLAAGVPLYRLAVPFLVGLLITNGVMAVNQEWIMPRIAHHLQVAHDATASDPQGVEPTYDRQSWIFVSGRSLSIADRLIQEAEFGLPAELAEGAVTLRAREASFLPEKKGLPAGWLLAGVQPRFEQLRLTDGGREIVLARHDPEQIFIRSDLTFDQLYHGSTSYRYLSTPELLRRIRRPTAGLTARRAQIVHLHKRLTGPLLTLVGLFMILPLITRKDRLSLVTNVAVCMTACGSVYAAAQALLLLGNTGLMNAELCAWAPLIGGGAFCVWLVPMART